MTGYYTVVTQCYGQDLGYNSDICYHPAAVAEGNKIREYKIMNLFHRGGQE